MQNEHYLMVMRKEKRKMGLFGLGKKRATASMIFVKHYNSILKSVNKLPVSTNGETELLSAMFVVCDYATASARKDRRKISDEILDEIRTINKGFISKQFDKRNDLYGDVLRGKPLRGEWMMFNTTSFEGNPIMKITAVFGDIIYNPNWADNYDAAPLVLYGIDVKINFFNGMKPILDEFVELFKEIYNL